MDTKAFLVILVAVVVLGGSLGGAFGGGVALGKSQGEDVESSPIATESTAVPDQQTSGQVGAQDLTELRERIQSGEVSQDEIAQLRQQFQGQGGRGGGLGGVAGGGGLTGTIESIQGETVTIDTAQGPLQAIVDAETTIQMFTEGTLSDIETGVRVTVVGQRDEDGSVTAISIVINPPGAEGFLGGGGFPGGRFQGDRQQP